MLPRAREDPPCGYSPWSLRTLEKPRYDKKTIEDAVDELTKDPSIGVVLPRIPGKSDEDISYLDDISTIGSQYGLLMTERVRTAHGTTESLLLLREKLVFFERVSRGRPGLYTQLLGIPDEGEFNSFAARTRRLRNEFAHPDPGGVFETNIDTIPLTETDKEFARRLADWNTKPFTRRRR